MFKFSNRSINNLKGVHPDLVKLLTEAVKDCPIDFTIIEGVRTTERQQELYAQGRSKSGTIVTQMDGVKQKSNHQTKKDGYGYAVDLYPFVNGKVEVNDVNSLIKIANHIKSIALKMGIPLIWGGDWRMKDYPHFELNR